MDRKRSSWPWGVAIVIAIPVLYVASFGPVCWWYCKSMPLRGNSKTTVVQAPYFYWPLGWLVMHGPSRVSRAFAWYATRGAPVAHLPANLAGRVVVEVYKDDATKERSQNGDKMLIL